MFPQDKGPKGECGRADSKEDVDVMLRRAVIMGLAALSLAVLGPVDGVRAGSHEDGAARFIEDLADKAITSLADDAVSKDIRKDRFRTLLNDGFAIKLIGRWVLGRYWKKATKAEKAEYLKLFEEMLVTSYFERFTLYAGVKVAIIKTITAGKRDAVVFSTITRPKGGNPLRVNWRVRNRDGIFKIVDIMVEGISMGQAQRSEFSSVIRQHGGEVEGLLAELRKRLAALRGEKEKEEDA